MEENKKDSEKSIEKKVEDVDLMTLIHSYRQLIDFEKKSIKNLKGHASPDGIEKIKGYLKDAEGVLSELPPIEMSGFKVKSRLGVPTIHDGLNP